MLCNSRRRRRRALSPPIPPLLLPHCIPAVTFAARPPPPAFTLPSLAAYTVSAPVPPSYVELMSTSLRRAESKHANPSRSCSATAGAARTPAPTPVNVSVIGRGSYAPLLLALLLAVGDALVVAVTVPLTLLLGDDATVAERLSDGVRELLGAALPVPLLLSDFVGVQLLVAVPLGFVEDRVDVAVRAGVDAALCEARAVWEHVGLLLPVPLELEEPLELALPVADPEPEGEREGEPAGLREAAALSVTAALCVALPLDDGVPELEPLPV